MTEETWRTIPSYPKYEASNLGRVRGGRGVLRPSNRNGGYSQVVLSLGTKATRRSRKVHHLVLEAFVCPRPSGLVGRHLNDDNTDNRLQNLQWGTQKENAEDRKRNGGYRRKKSCPKGHPYDEHGVDYGGATGIQCRICVRSAVDRYQAKKKECS